MLKSLKQLLFLAITLVSTTSKSMLDQQDSLKVHSPKPKQVPLVAGWLYQFNNEEEGKIKEENEESSSEEENTLQTIRISCNKFDRIYKELQGLYKQKRLIQETIKKDRKDKKKLDIDSILVVMNKIKIPLHSIGDDIANIEDDSEECLKIIKLYEGLIEYLDTFLNDYYL